jgi:predicted transglutaminase-like cysteine proteinase
MKNVKKQLALIMCMLILFCSYAFAQELDEIISGSQLVIRQQRYKTKGVLVCRPHSVDEKILSIIKNNHIRSLMDYMKWLQENVKYTKDNDGDKWLTPEEMLFKKGGDCEDFAFLNKAVLTVLGYSPEVISLDGIEARGHAICVFQSEGDYLWMDNNEIKKMQAKSALEFFKYLFHKYGCKSISSLDLETKRRQVLFKRSEMIL